jgi:hypothetical protein
MKNNLLSLGILLMAFASCIKHEIVPAPKPMVDLTSSFSADTNGVAINYKTGTDGYAVTCDNYREIKSSPMLSSIVFYNTLKSDSKVDQVKLSAGHAEWDASTGNFPPLQTVTDFLSKSTPPVYSTGGMNGVEIIWKDATGVIWKTKDTSQATMPQTFSFTSVTQESDETGDYFKFKASFDCYLYNSSETDSIHLTNGIYTSYFKNN